MVAAEMHKVGNWLGCDIDPVAEVAVKSFAWMRKWIPEVAVPAGQDCCDDFATIARTTLPLRSAPDKRKSPNIKAILYQRQKGRCAAPCAEETLHLPREQRVGIKLPMRLFELDHIRAKSYGGGDEDANMQLLCPDCNQRKHSKLWSQFQDEVLNRVA